jgi:hypothetical protein
MMWEALRSVFCCLWCTEEQDSCPELEPLLTNRTNIELNRLYNSGPINTAELRRAIDPDTANWHGSGDFTRGEGADVKHTVTIKGYLHCIICYSAKDNIQLSCGHKACQRCIRGLCLEAGEFKPLSAIRCPPQCGQQLGESVISQVYNLEVLETFRINEAARRVRFTCEVCYAISLVDEAITLDCNHRFCKECMGEYLTDKIKSAEVSSDKLICPSCPTSVSFYTIQYCVDQATLKLYNEFAIRQIDFRVNHEVLK